VKDFIEKYFNQALQSFLEYQQRVEEQIRRTHGLPSAFPLVSAWTKAVLQPFSSVLAGGTSKESTSPPPEPSGDHSAQLEQTVRELRAQVAELRQRARKGGKAGRRAEKGK
jgi:hypothetical protein